MTLDEAIVHCREKSGLDPCGKEHARLAEWLIELRDRRNVEYSFDTQSEVTFMPAWLLKLFHKIGLTNLTDKEVSRYCHTHIAKERFAAIANGSPMTPEELQKEQECDLCLESCLLGEDVTNQ